MDKKYRRIFTRIGFWYGLVGAAIFIFLVLLGLHMSDTAVLPEFVRIPLGFVLIPFSFFAVISAATGALGCNFKVETCHSEYILGAVVAGFAVWGIGFLIGYVVDLFKN